MTLGVVIRQMRERFRNGVKSVDMRPTCHPEKGRYYLDVGQTE